MSIRFATTVIPALLAMAAPAGVHAGTQSDAAIRLYVDVVEGRTHYSQLNAQQRWQVDEVARLVREKQLVIDLRNNEQRCRDNERQTSGNAPSPLASRAIDMKCREAY